MRHAHVCHALRDLIAVIIRTSALAIGFDLSDIYVAEELPGDICEESTPGMVPFQIL